MLKLGLPSVSCMGGIRSVGRIQISSFSGCGCEVGSARQRVAGGGSQLIWKRSVSCISGIRSVGLIQISSFSGCGCEVGSARQRVAGGGSQLIWKRLPRLLDIVAPASCWCRDRVQKGILVWRIGPDIHQMLRTFILHWTQGHFRLLPIPALVRQSRLVTKELRLVHEIAAQRSHKEFS